MMTKLLRRDEITANNKIKKVKKVVDKAENL